MTFTTRERLAYAFPVITLKGATEKVVFNKKSLFFVVGASAILLGISLLIEVDSEISGVFSVMLIIMGVVDFLGGILGVDFLRSLKKKK